MSEPLVHPAADLQDEVDSPAQRRTVRVLSLGQVLGGVGVGIGIAVGGLLAEQLADTESVAGLAQTAAVIGSAVLAVPASRLMARAGRRPGLVASYAVAVLGCATVVLAAVLGSFALMLPGMFLFGAGTTAGLQARYAATDLASPRRRGTALSVVVWATTIGAVLGPNLADPSGRAAVSVGLPRLAGAFVVAALLLALAAVAVSVFLRPDPLLLARELSGSGTEPPAGTSVRAALGAVVSTVDGRLGLTAMAVSHSVMVGVMVLTPVHLGHGGATLTVIGIVISVHIAGMYAFSPIVGTMADRVGRRPVVLAGAFILAGALAVAGTAPAGAAGQLGIGLFLIGVGWSCGLIAGSTMVTESVPVTVRPQAQGATDLVMGLSAGLAGALAGPIVDGLGYGALNVAAGVLLIPLLVLALRAGRGGPDAVSRGRGTA